MTIEVNNSGTWTAPRVYINNSGTWTEPNEIHVNDSGTWKLVYKKVDVTSSTQNININTLMGSPSYPLTAVVNISGSLTIGSSSTSNPAITTSGLPAGSKVFLIIGSGTYVVGKGGVGGSRGPGTSANNIYPGTAGGTALYTRVTTYLDNSGTIGGGGGGGGSGGVTYLTGQAYDDYTGGGGGGAGNDVGAGGTSPVWAPGTNSGTLTTGGAGVQWASSGGSSEQQTGSYGGNGGNLGSAGSNGTPLQSSGGNTNTGGAAGNAIDGVSYVTKKVAGTITGGEIN